MENKVVCASDDAVTDDERALMKQDIIDKMNSIRDLLNTYRESQMELEQVVAEFVVRDVGEQNQMHAIATHVLDQQRVSLSNPEYVRWASSNQKGEFSPKYTSGGVSKSSPKESTTPTTCNNDDEEVTSWYDRVRGCTPETVVTLDVYSGVKQHLLGWRRLNISIQSQLEALSNALMENADGKQQYIVLINGFPVISPDAYSSATVEHTIAEQTDMLWAIHDREGTEGVGLWWLGTVMRESSVATAAEVVRLLCASPSVKNCFVEDSSDVISIVPLDAMVRAVPIRFFIINGVIKALEVMDPKCNVVSPIFHALHLSQANFEPLIVKACDKFVAEHRADCREGEALFHEGRKYVVMAMLGCDAVAEKARLVITDIRGLSPSVPFLWHLSWAEVCGLSKTNDSNRDFQVRFKVTTSRVVELESYDELSVAWFPLLNECIANRGRQGHLPNAQTNNRPVGIDKTPTTPPPVGLSTISLVVGALGVASLSIAATSFFLKSR